MRKNKGYAVVEACVVVPLFLFFTLALSSLAMVLLAESHIHQSLIEAAEDTALSCYLESKVAVGEGTGYLMDITILTKQFRTYLGDDFFVEYVVKGGTKGVIVSLKPDLENDRIFTARADFWVGYKLPILNKYFVRMTVEVKKKAFVGYGPDEDSETYVYITPNEAVYHTHRSCSHLSLSVRQIRVGQESGYTPCSFCGKKESHSKKRFVTRTGSIYHSRADCSGLKRTVKRVPLRQVSGLSPCQRCSR